MNSFYPKRSIQKERSLTRVPAVSDPHVSSILLMVQTQGSAWRGWSDAVETDWWSLGYSTGPWGSHNWSLSSVCLEETTLEWPEGQASGILGWAGRKFLTFNMNLKTCSRGWENALRGSHPVSPSGSQKEPKASTWHCTAMSRACFRQV